MAAAISIPFLHPVLITVVVIGAVVCAWGAPAQLRERRWWPAASLGLGVLAAVIAALAGAVPWFGQLHLAMYSLCLAAGFVLAFLLLRRRAALLGVRQAWLLDAFGIAVVLGIVGARARYVYERWDTFRAEAHGDLQQALLLAADLDRGGAVWYGGVTLATIGVATYIRYRKIPLLAFADAGLPALIAGLAVGRIGCLLNGCCYGAPTSLPWGISCAHYPGQLVHPTQLYETVACAILATLLMWFWTRRRRDGQVAFFAVVGYALWRFCNEGLRGDHDAFAYGGTLLTTSQATSIHLVLAAVVVAVAIGWYRRTHPAAAIAAARVPGSRFAAPATLETPAPISSAPA